MIGQSRSAVELLRLTTWVAIAGIVLGAGGCGTGEYNSRFEQTLSRARTPAAPDTPADGEASEGAATPADAVPSPT